MIIAWFSCGATSAVACKLALTMYNDVRIVYIETGSGHPDNERFINDCERWFGKRIECIRSKEFRDIDDVFIRKKYQYQRNAVSYRKIISKLSANYGQKSAER